MGKLMGKLRNTSRFQPKIFFLILLFFFLKKNYFSYILLEVQHCHLVLTYVDIL